MVHVVVQHCTSDDGAVASATGPLPIIGREAESCLLYMARGRCVYWVQRVCFGEVGMRGNQPRVQQENKVCVACA